MRFRSKIELGRWSLFYANTFGIVDNSTKKFEGYFFLFKYWKFRIISFVAFVGNCISNRYIKTSVNVDGPDKIIFLFSFLLFTFDFFV